MNNGFFYAEILNTDRTLNPIKISKKSKILNMPKMAQNGSKWQKLGLNSCYFCISGLNMSQLNVKSDTDNPEKISKKSQTLNMPKMAQNGYFGHKKLQRILLAKNSAKWTSPCFSGAFLLSTSKNSVQKCENTGC